jgi:hypothetical protein
VPNTVVLAEVRVVMGRRIALAGPVVPRYSVLAEVRVVVRKAETLQGLAEFGVRIPKVEARRLEPLTKQE